MTRKKLTEWFLNWIFAPESESEKMASKLALIQLQYKVLCTQRGYWADLSAAAAGKITNVARVKYMVERIEAVQ